MKMFVFIFSLAIWASLFYMKHIQILTEFLKKTLILAQKGALSQKAFSQRLFSFLNEHTKISMLYNFTDQEVWSRVSFHCMACQIPTNIYIVYRAMDPKLSGSKLIVTYLFMVNQIVMIFIALMFLAKAAKVIPQGHRYIPKLQCFIPKTMLLFKLKYMQLYERLNNKKKIGTAVGPIGTITYKMNFRVCLIKLNALTLVFCKINFVFIFFNSSFSYTLLTFYISSAFFNYEHVNFFFINLFCNFFCIFVQDLYTKLRYLQIFKSAIICNLTNKLYLAKPVLSIGTVIVLTFLLRKLVLSMHRLNPHRYLT